MIVVRIEWANIKINSHQGCLNNPIIHSFTGVAEFKCEAEINYFCPKSPRIIW